MFTRYCELTLMKNAQPDTPKGDILIVDDALPNLRVLSSMLTEQGYEVRGAPDGPTALMIAEAAPPDLILLDIRMPGMDGYQVCQRLKAEAKTHHVPVIFLSALEEVEDKVKGFAAGGVDYITKPFQLEEIVARVETHLTLHNLQKQLEAQNTQLQQEITERKQVEEALQRVNEALEQRVAERTANLAQANANLQAEIAERQRAEQKIRRRNRELALLNRVIAVSATTPSVKPESVLEITCRELALAFNVPQVASFLLNEKRTEAVVVAEYLAEGRPPALNKRVPVEGTPLAQHLLTHRAPLIVHDVQTDPGLISVRDFLRQHGVDSLLLVPLVVEAEVIGCLGLDATGRPDFSAEEVNLAWNVANQVAGTLARIRLNEERQQLEAQYHQAQKMEAVGRLAGGVAHDFNNLLTAIMGYVGLTLYTLSPDDPTRQDVEGIQKTAERASNLTRQLLTFARKQTIHPTVLNLNELILNLDKMLRRLIREDIELVTLPTPDLGQIKADPGQIEQVLLNLAVNARDAMPRGGKLTIETANVTLDEAYARQHAEVTAGEYIMLSVSDTGMGMTEKVKAHIFEPFFTTKQKGEGTGLGLATCFGIVKQSGGHIWVYSELDRGTTFKIYLPRLAEAVSPILDQNQSDDLPHGTETVLLVEDEPAVRELASRALRQRGYKVLEAANGDEALRVAQEQAEETIHLLLTDVVMPRLDGKELANRLQSIRPDIKVLFTSGYTDNTIVHHGVLEPGIAFLPKPFSPLMVVRKVREVLDE